MQTPRSMLDRNMPENQIANIVKTGDFKAGIKKMPTFGGL